jgi:hypothetical protein
LVLSLGLWKSRRRMDARKKGRRRRRRRDEKEGAFYTPSLGDKSLRRGFPPCPIRPHEEEEKGGRGVEGWFWTNR